MQKVDLFWVILSVICPIVGLILFFVKRDDESAAAITYLIAAIGGSVVSMLILVGLL